MGINWKPNKYLGEGKYNFIIADGGVVADDNGHEHLEFLFQTTDDGRDKEARIYNPGEYAELCKACGVAESAEVTSLIGRTFTAEIYKTAPNSKGKTYYNMRGYAPIAKAQVAPRNDPKVNGVLAPKPAASKWGAKKADQKPVAVPEATPEGDSPVPF